MKHYDQLWDTMTDCGEVNRQPDNESTETHRLNTRKGD